MKFFWPLLILIIAGCATTPKPAKVEEKAVLPVDQKWLQEIAGEHNHDVLVCYQNRLKTKPKLAGDLRLEFLATQQGEMTDVKITNPVDPEVDRCVLAATK